MCSSFAYLLLVSSAFADMHTYLATVKLTQQGETISCTCSFTMQLKEKMDVESKPEVDVAKSRLLCKEECTGTAAAEVELDKEESRLLYIIDAFTVDKGKGTIQSAMVIEKRPPPSLVSNDTCTIHTRACEDAFLGLGVRGFCGDKSMMGGHCAMAEQPGAKHYCQGKDCTCCKECLDVTNKCSARGPGWSCHNRKAALALPEGSCYFDRSCSSAPDSPYKDSSCVCCKPPVNPCEDYGCSEEWDGMGACVNVTEADWAWVDNSFNLSVPAIPGKCGPDCPDSYCVCLKKKEPCADQGCSSFFGGFGVCLNALDPEFSATSPDIDFTAGGREDLCAGCCSCFKKRCIDSVHGSVGFAVDTTGSMQKSLPLVKATIVELVSTGSEVPHWFLTGFNDPDVNLVKETTSPDEMKLAAEGLTFSGGGDSKEQAIAGIDVTLDAMPDNGIILVFTDNGSHQLELENTVKEKSEKKNVKILFAILTSPGVIDNASLEVYESLSHGEPFYSTEDGSEMVDIKAFFEAVVNTVQHPCHPVVKPTPSS